MGSADPNPSWTRAPWAGVPQPSSLVSGVVARGAPPHAPRPGVAGAALSDAARMPPPPPRLPARASTDAEPSWQSFFDAAVDVPAGQGDVFRVYLAGRTGPLVLCLHGAGCTALSFAAVAPALAAAASCRVAAVDLRGHGASRCADEGNLSSEARFAAAHCAAQRLTQSLLRFTQRLVADVLAVAHELLGRCAADDAARTASPLGAPPPLVLVGHSMGGSVAARVAAQEPRLATLSGVVVLDVVEGTALAAAPAMLAMLSSRPHRFVDVEDARAWARAAPGPAFSSQLVPATDGRGGVVWRTPLQVTVPFWDGWFRGLSAAFLAHKLPKLLMLADTDRLDNELMIAQMQGRFQLVLMPGAGHALHEDAPEATAAALAAFVRRCCTTASSAAHGAAVTTVAAADTGS